VSFQQQQSFERWVRLLQALPAGALTADGMTSTYNNELLILESI
jgi:hypothetical protein